MGECPERQRGRTVNPLATPSQVRVLLPPPSFYLVPRISSGAQSRFARGCGVGWLAFAGLKNQQQIVDDCLKGGHDNCGNIGAFAC